MFRIKVTGNGKGKIEKSILIRKGEKERRKGKKPTNSEASKQKQK